MKLSIIKLYDTLGNEIDILVNEEKEAGRYETQFNIERLRFASLSSGIYYYR